MKDLSKELDKLKNSLIKDIPENDKNFVYLRLSMLDFDKEDPVKDALEKLKSDFDSILDNYPYLKKDGLKLFIEVQSAYKNSVREEFVNLYENYLLKDVSIKDVLENNKDLEEKNLYVTSFDRISRVFLYSLSFQMIRKICNINIYSLMSEEYDLEIKSKDLKNQDNQQQLLYVFQLMMFSSMASKHSEDMSYKIKKRLSKNDKGETVSSKSGKKWGVKKTISDKMRKKIIERGKKFTYKEISQQQDIYQDLSDYKKSLSVHTVRAIISRSK